jgi:hypothetical protein
MRNTFRFVWSLLTVQFSALAASGTATGAMSKRALAAEVSEYTSLLRALQAADTLDITAHLARPHVPNDVHDETDSASPTKATDACDRWPLLLHDVYVPEWSFADEVRLLASQARRALDEEPEADLEDEGPTSDVLTDAASAYLSGILAAIADHVPLTAKSLQNRLSPLGWESVLQIVSASRLVNEKHVVLRPLAL